MEKTEKNGPCPFRSDCGFLGSGCDKGGFVNCPEADKRKLAAKTPCPLMKGSFSDKCNVPQFRALLPDPKMCSGGKCPVIEQLGAKLNASDFRDIPLEPVRIPQRSLSENNAIRAVLLH